MNIISQIVGFIGSLCLLLFGMNMLSNGIQKCARLPNANREDRTHFSSLLHITDTLENLSDETCSLMHTVQKYVSNKTFDSSSIRAKEIEDYVERAGDCVYAMLQSV